MRSRWGDLEEDSNHHYQRCSPTEMRRWCWRRLGPSTTRTRRRRTTASSPPRGSRTPRPSGTTPCCWQSPRLSTSSRIKDRSLSLHRETQTSLPTGHIRSILSILTYIPYRIIQDLPAGAGRGQEYLQPVRHGEQVEGAEWGPGALRLQDLHAAAARGQEHLQFGGHRQ